MRTNHRVAILLRKDKKILFLHRKKRGREYYILPGGGVESNESIREAVSREAKEELGINIKILKEFARFNNKGNVEHYFEGETKEKLRVVEDQNLHSFIEDKPEWIPNNQILDRKILPDKLRLTLERYLNNDREHRYSLAQFNFENVHNKCPYLPELVDNINIYENSIWHSNESVFDHTLKVVEIASEIIKHIKPEIKKHLAEKVDRYSKKRLFLLSTLLHDIGKKDTIIPTENKDTDCPSHEKIGATMAINILKRFDLSLNESKRTKEIIENHGEIHLLLDGTELNKQKLTKFKSKYKNIYWGLVLLGAADVAATAPTTRKEGKDNLLFRINFYAEELGLSKKQFLELFPKPNLI